MNDLKSVLQRLGDQGAVERRFALGGGGLSDQARTALEAYRRQAALVSGAVLAVVFAAVLVVLAASIFYLRNPAGLKLAVSGLGLSLGAALVVLRGTWKDWSQANLLLVLIEDARDDQIKRMIDTLIAKL
jgi:hypothetical protein